MLEPSAKYLTSFCPGSTRVRLVGRTTWETCVFKKNHVLKYNL